jgi:hypothetical protein
VLTHAGGPPLRNRIHLSNSAIPPSTSPKVSDAHRVPVESSIECGVMNPIAGFKWLDLVRAICGLRARAYEERCESNFAYYTLGDLHRQVGGHDRKRMRITRVSLDFELLR